MKRTILIALALACCSLTSAQVYVGGNVGITSGRDGVGIGVYIAPEVGYCINDSFTVGGTLSYRSSYNSFGVNPYSRWHFVSLGDVVRLFVSVNAPMRFYADTQVYGLTVRPGATVRIADRVSLIAHIGSFGYSWAKVGDQRSSGWVARLDGDSISIGFCFSI